MVRPFSGKDKSVDVFNFIAKFKLSLRAYPGLKDEHKSMILQSLLVEDSEMHVSNLLLSEPEIADNTDKILDSLISTFILQKNSSSSPKLHK